MKILSVIATFSILTNASLLDSLDFTEFENLHRELKPVQSAWKSIPWHLNLVTAQQAAIEQNKPLFIWAMDGHPLGCT